jgi:DNA-3-methyladenine glycosylase II
MTFAHSSEALAAMNPAWRRLFEAHGPCAIAPEPHAEPYEQLFKAIVFQQLAGKAAQTILNRVLALYPEPFPAPQTLLATPEEALRGAGLSRNKQAALRDLAAKRLEGVVPPSTALAAMSDEDILERLVQVRGIGRWTVQMYLMFTLGRPDVWPHDDLGVRRGLERAFGVDLPPKQLAVWGEQWAPHRTAAAWYSWRASEGPLVARDPNSSET